MSKRDASTEGEQPGQRSTRGPGDAAVDQGGRPPHVVTDENRKAVREFAMVGVRQAEIAEHLDIDEKTLRKYYAKDFKRGTLHASAKIGESLYNMARKGNVAAAIFWLKARRGWSDKGPREGEDALDDGPRERRPLVLNVVDARIRDPDQEGAPIASKASAPDAHA